MHVHEALVVPIWQILTFPTFCILGLCQWRLHGIRQHLLIDLGRVSYSQYHKMCWLGHETLLNQSINLSIYQSINLSIYLSMNQLINQSISLTRAHTCAHAHTHTRTHARTHARTHTHTHTHGGSNLLTYGCSKLDLPLLLLRSNQQWLHIHVWVLHHTLNHIQY